jgi:hypothetical protein
MNLNTLFLLNLFSCLFLMLVVDALLILNAIMHCLCSSPIALYGELRLHFMAFFIIQYRLEILPKFKYSSNLNETTLYQYCGL